VSGKNMNFVSIDNLYYLCKSLFWGIPSIRYVNMVVVIEKKYDKRKINKLIGDLKPVKVFDAKKFAGKVNWEEDPVEYQKRIRNEWD
jgi:hypothetical protein